MKKPIDYAARFETVGELYYLHSGRLLPGKDEPLGTNRDSSSPENRAAFGMAQAQNLARFAMRAVHLMNMIDDREHPDVAEFMSEEPSDD